LVVRPRELIALLNRYFDCQVPAIEARDGEVLKFMGDGLLAIFPIAYGGPGHGCARAPAAAREARANILALRRELTTERSPELPFSLALHTGEVLYGNVGGGRRLDFTVIGPAVNLTAGSSGSRATSAALSCLRRVRRHVRGDTCAARQLCAAQHRRHSTGVRIGRGERTRGRQRRFLALNAAPIALRSATEQCIDPSAPLSNTLLVNSSFLHRRRSPRQQPPSPRRLTPRAARVGG
jgi:hypothetical protein